MPKSSKPFCLLILTAFFSLALVPFAKPACSVSVDCLGHTVDPCNCACTANFTGLPVSATITINVCDGPGGPTDCSHTTPLGTFTTSPSGAGSFNFSVPCNTDADMSAILTNNTS